MNTFRIARLLRGDGRDEAGKQVAAGAYLVRFEAAGARVSQRVVRLQ